MGYYRGDYYRGDYYSRRGAPGFLSFLGGALKTVGGFIPGVGPLLEGAGSAIEKVGAPKAVVTGGGLVAKAMPGVSALTQRIKTSMLKHPVLTGAGAAGLAAGAGALAGAKLEKHLAGGGRKRRRMRATNTKALRRALRRAYAFERIAMKTIKLVHPRKHGRFGGFKRAKKRVC